MSCNKCIHKDVCAIALELKPVRIFDCHQFKDTSKFIELPYGVGDSIYYVDTVGNIYGDSISNILVLIDDIRIDLECGLEFSYTLINKRFFLSREKAVLSLKRRIEK